MASRMKTRNKLAAANKRFCEMAAEVFARIVVLGKTVGRNPNFGAVEPPLRKAAGTLCVMRGQRVTYTERSKEICVK